MAGVRRPLRGIYNLLISEDEAAIPGSLMLRRRAIVASSFGRTSGRVQGHTAKQIPQDADSAK